MARQSAARRPTESSRSGGNTTESPRDPADLIRFDPELAVRAIAFHLADEGISPQVDEQSARATVVRLRRSSAATLSVEQWIWSEMTNPQRLEWLLERTQTASRLISDEVSVLEPARA